MKTSHLVNLLLAIMVVGASALPASSSELSQLIPAIGSESAPGDPIDRASAVKDLTNMKISQKGGEQANSFSVAAVSPLSDGSTAIQIGNTIGYADASGRLLGLVNP